MNHKECERHDQTLQVYPENLSSRPRVKEIVNIRSDDWNEHEGHLEQGVSVHPLEILRTNAHLAGELRLIEHATIGKSKQLEREDHRPIDDLVLGRLVQLFKFFIIVVFFEQTVLVEFIKNPVEHIVTDQSERYEQGRGRMSILDKEGDIVEQESNAPSSLEG